jgi:hypothetical protein
VLLDPLGLLEEEGLERKALNPLAPLRNSAIAQPLISGR